MGRWFIEIINFQDMESLKRKREESQEAEPEDLVTTIQNDLAINPAKAKELYEELSEFQLKNQGKILVLHGPHGSGKTVAIKLISKTLNLPLHIWSPKDICEENFYLSYFDQLSRDLKNMCSIRNRIKIPGCIARQEPAKVIVIDSIPFIYNDAQKREWEKLIFDLSAYNKKIICFIASNVSKKTLLLLFQCNSCKVIE